MLRRDTRSDSLRLSVYVFASERSDDQRAQRPMHFAALCSKDNICYSLISGILLLTTVTKCCRTLRSRTLNIILAS